MERPILKMHRLSNSKKGTLAASRKSHSTSVDKGLTAPIDHIKGQMENMASTYKRDSIQNMTDKTFTGYKKLLLMESRNLQEKH